MPSVAIQSSDNSLLIIRLIKSEIMIVF